jgi:hypothetical protein
MKILYIAANPYNQEILDFSPEITEIQRRVLGATSVEFVAMPSLKFEDLASTLHQQKPDILHIAAHGNDKALFLANYSNESIQLDADMLNAFFSDVSPPRLVYLNACNSLEIAEKLSRAIAIAIGSTAPISVKAARATAVSFYERILDGASVDHAFDVCKQVMRGASDDSAEMKIYTRTGVNKAEVLHHEPRFVAEFTKKRPSRDKKDCYEIRFGVLKYPLGTRQIVFFTDDPESVNPKQSLQEALCTVVRDMPQQQGLVFAEEAWDIEGDFRLYAVGVYGDDRTFTLSTMLSDALKARYQVSHPAGIPQVIAEAIADLRATM